MRSEGHGPLFGRSEPLRALTGLFDDHVRLVTLVGPAGIGKSRLAEEHAGSRADSLWVELSEVRTAAQLAAEIAMVLRGSVSPAKSDRAALDTIGVALDGVGGRLLVLDNADGAIEPLAAALPLWLEAAPRLDIVCTSRERLNIAGEEVLAIESLADEAAVELFLHRAPSARSMPDAEVIAGRIAGRLEGNPLALELAASRVGALTLSDLESRLAEPLELLSTHRRDIDRRHESLRAAIAVSWELLDDGGRLALCECAVLAPDFELGAAEAVLSPAGVSVLDRLQGLCDRSLIRVAHRAGAARFSMSDVVRDFALREGGGRREAAELHRRRAEYLADRAEHWAVELDGLDGMAALDAIEAEAAGMEAAVERFARSDPALAARLAGPLARAVILRGPASRVGELLEPVVRGAREIGASAIAAELLRLGAAARREHRDMDGALRLAAEALERAEEAGDAEQGAAALVESGNVCRQWGRLDDAAGFYARALERLDDPAAPHAVRARYGAALIEHLRGEVDDLSHYDAIARDCRATGDARSEARIENSRAALFWDRGYVDDARRSLQRSCELSRRTGGVQSEGIAWLSIADLELDAGRPDEAVAAWDKASACFSRVGFDLGEGFVSSSRARLAHERGELQRARALAECGLDISRAWGFRTLTAICHAKLAMLDVEERAVDAAATRMVAAVEDITATGDGRFEPFILALSAWVEHLCKREGASRELVQRAEARMARMELVRRSQREAVAALASLCDGREPAADASGWEARLVLRLARREIGGEPPARRAPILRLASDGRWFDLGDGRVDLSRRGALRRVLDSLARARVAEPGRCRSVFELLDDGWPGQDIHAEAGAQRVYWVIATLRKLGLGAHLQTLDDGYRLDEALVVQRNE